MLIDPLRFWMLPIMASLLMVAGCHKDAKVQPRQVARDFFIYPPTNGARHELNIILTNRQSPVMIHAAITISRERQFQFVTVQDDGQQRPAIIGVVPADIFDGVVSEVRAHDAEAKAKDEPVYIAATDAKHPPHIQRLLEFLTK